MTRAYTITAMLVLAAIVSYFYMNYRISEIERLINLRSVAIEDLIEIKPTFEKIEKQLGDIHRSLRELRQLVERNADEAKPPPTE